MSNKIVSEKKINIDYILFIKRLIDNNIVVGEKNKDKIIKFYKEVVNLKFNNLERVGRRVNRIEIVDKKREILKNEKIEEKEFNKISNKVILLSRIRKNNYY